MARRLPATLGMNMLTLRDLPESVCTNEYTSVSHVVHDRKSCVVHMITHPSKTNIEIVFGGVVGVKILDERDFCEFWRSNMESFDEIEGALVSQVFSGGWSQHGEILESHVPTGFYGDVMEFFVSSDNECVNILCTEQPHVRIHA
jgi:hypothetical protein